MGRLKTNVSGVSRDSDGPGWQSRYRSEWAEVVGGRVRRLRQGRGWTLRQLAERLPKPEGGCYSAGYCSRLERGWGSPPLWVYIELARVFDVAPGKLLGVEDVEHVVSAEQGLLLRFLDRMGIEPAEALARIARPS